MSSSSRSAEPWAPPATERSAPDQRPTTSWDGLPTMVGASESMLRVLDRAKRAAQVDSTVLITGEPGTGKRSIAEMIHRASHRAAGPWVVIEVAALPDTAVEGEWFGAAEEGGVSHAAPHRGPVEAAQGGTLYIDEVADLDKVAQARLLGVLEHRRFAPSGGDHERELDVRLIGGSSRDLETLLASRRFREDLYYRLSVVTIAVPPLRRRREDISVLVQHFLEQAASFLSRPAPGVEPELERFLESYDWPGNVRQLRNCVENMVRAAASDTLTMDDLPQSMSQEPPLSALDVQSRRVRTLADLERMAVLRALEERRGNRTRTAESLGISVRTLQRKLKKWRE